MESDKIISSDRLWTDKAADGQKRPSRDLENCHRTRSYGSLSRDSASQIADNMDVNKREIEMKIFVPARDEFLSLESAVRRK